MSYVKPVVASAEACLTPLSCGTDTKTTSEADNPPLRTECVGTNPRALKFQKLSQKGSKDGSYHTHLYSHRTRLCHHASERSAAARKSR